MCQPDPNATHISQSGVEEKVKTPSILHSHLIEYWGIHYFKCFFFVSKLLSKKERAFLLSSFFQKVELRKCILFQIYTFNLSTFFNFLLLLFLFSSVHFCFILASIPYQLCAENCLQIHFLLLEIQVFFLICYFFFYFLFLKGHDREGKECLPSSLS